MIEVTEQRLVDAEKVRELQKRAEILMRDPDCCESAYTIKWTMEELGLWDPEVRKEHKIIVRDIVRDRDNEGIEVVIRQAFSRDCCSPLREELWRGRAEETPKEYWPLEVLEVGWLIGQEAQAITVIRDETRERRK